MNILFFLTPKAKCDYLREENNIRQALERMEGTGFMALPILGKDGHYRGTLTEGDLLWSLKNLCDMDLQKARDHSIMEIAHRRDNQPVRVDTRVEDLFSKALDQNFVPVVDDRGTFIGIVTRSAIMRYCMDTYIKPDKKDAL